eukprot:12260341-Ditylum_brightwellii.AAC.1
MPLSPADCDKTGGIVFTIPVTVPPNVPPGSVLRFSLLVRSGAALLKSKALQKNYTLGMAYITIQDIYHTFQTQRKEVSIQSLPLSGGILSSMESIRGSSGKPAALD